MTAKPKVRSPALRWHGFLCLRRSSRAPTPTRLPSTSVTAQRTEGPPRREAFLAILAARPRHPEPARCPQRSSLARHPVARLLQTRPSAVPDAPPEHASHANRFPSLTSPFRNAHFLAVAVSWAEVLGAETDLYRRRRAGQLRLPRLPVPAYYQAYNEVIRTGTKRRQNPYCSLR